MIVSFSEESNSIDSYSYFKRLSFS